MREHSEWWSWFKEPLRKRDYMFSWEKCHDISVLSQKILINVQQGSKIIIFKYIFSTREKVFVSLSIKKVRSFDWLWAQINSTSNGDTFPKSSISWEFLRISFPWGISGKAWRQFLSCSSAGRYWHVWGKLRKASQHPTKGRTALSASFYTLGKGSSSPKSYWCSSWKTLP